MAKTTGRSIDRSGVAAPAAPKAQQHTPPCLAHGLGGGHGLPAAAGLVGATGAGHGRGLLDGGQGACLFHALVVLDLLLPAFLAAECHLAPARPKYNRIQLVTNRQTYFNKLLHSRGRKYKLFKPKVDEGL